MGGLCGCFGGESEPPTPLDAQIQDPANTDIGLVDGAPRTRRLLGFQLFGARRPNFDFVTHDNGETYIATFRAMNVAGEVMGYDSNPIPKAVYNEFRIIKKFKRGNVYAIILDTNDHNLDPFVNKMTKEDYEKLDIEQPQIDI